MLESRVEGGAGRACRRSDWESTEQAPLVHRDQPEILLDEKRERASLLWCIPTLFNLLRMFHRKCLQAQSAGKCGKVLESAAKCWKVRQSEEKCSYAMNLKSKNQSAKRWEGFIIMTILRRNFPTTFVDYKVSGIVIRISSNFCRRGHRFFDWGFVRVFIVEAIGPFIRDPPIKLPTKTPTKQIRQVYRSNRRENIQNNVQCILLYFFAAILIFSANFSHLGGDSHPDRL